jgi:hypothetical protein
MFLWVERGNVLLIRELYVLRLLFTAFCCIKKLLLYYRTGVFLYRIFFDLHQET